MKLFLLTLALGLTLRMQAQTITSASADEAAVCQLVTEFNDAFNARLPEMDAPLPNQKP